jgi:hypothetical protein
MFTQAMPALAQSLNGVLPPQAVRQIMQAFGNCNQPLEHRGPISVNPAPGRRQQGGVYTDSPWSPNNFTNLTNNFGGDFFNNNVFVDTATNNSFFGGDNFLFNNNQEFITNNFPTTVVFGQPGATGAAGAAGAVGAAGLAGLAGLNGFDGAPGVGGQNGVDGAPGALFLIREDGQAGRDGADGPPGQQGRNGFDGLVGPPGRRGRDGLQGGYELKEGLRGIPLGRLVTDVVAIPVTGTVSVPTYEFDAENCEVVAGENADYTFTVWPELQVQADDNANLRIPTYKLQQKATYP